jgi:hypothetical protein
MKEDRNMLPEYIGLLWFKAAATKPEQWRTRMQVSP